MIITLLKNVYPQFHPNKALELRAVVVAKRKTPVSAIEGGYVWMNKEST